MKPKEEFARTRHALLFLALLISATAGQLALAQDQPGGDHVLIVDVYSGGVAPDATQEKAFWLWLESLKKSDEPSGVWIPKVIHIEHALAKKDFDMAEQAFASASPGSFPKYNVILKGHVSRQEKGKFTIAFSELGLAPAYSGATELTLESGERRVLHLPIIAQPDGHGNLETVAVIWTPGLTKDQNGHSRFEVQ